LCNQGGKDDYRTVSRPRSESQRRNAAASQASNDTEQK
jgi:hypothetical protein